MTTIQRITVFRGKSTVSTMHTIRLFFPFFLDFNKNVTAYTLDAAIIQPCKKSNYPIKVYLPRAKVSGSWPAILEFQASSRAITWSNLSCPVTQVSAQPDWSGKKDRATVCENFWKFSSLEKIAYLILRAFNLRPGWISGKVYQTTYKIKDFPCSHMYKMYKPPTQTFYTNSFVVLSGTVTFRRTWKDLLTLISF